MRSMVGLWTTYLTPWACGRVRRGPEQAAAHDHRPGEEPSFGRPCRRHRRRGPSTHRPLRPRARALIRGPADRLSSGSGGGCRRPNVVSPMAVRTWAGRGEPEGRGPPEEVGGAGCRTAVVPARFHEGKHGAECAPRLRQMPQTRHDGWHAGHEVVDPGHRVPIGVSARPGIHPRAGGCR
jgi:hypothetical protein